MDKIQQLRGLYIETAEIEEAMNSDDEEAILFLETRIHTYYIYQPTFPEDYLPSQDFLAFTYWLKWANNYETGNLLEEGFVRIDDQNPKLLCFYPKNIFEWQNGGGMGYDSTYYKRDRYGLDEEAQPIIFFQKGLRIMHNKILKMQDFEDRQAIFKYVDLLLWVVVKTIQYGQKDTQEQLLIEVEILEEVFAELAEKSEELIFKTGYDADFPQKSFQISYPSPDEVIFLEDYWQFPYLNIVLNFDTKVIKKFKKRQTDWIEEMY